MLNPAAKETPLCHITPSVGVCEDYISPWIPTFGLCYCCKVNTVGCEIVITAAIVFHTVAVIVLLMHSVCHDNALVVTFIILDDSISYCFSFNSDIKP